MSVSPILSGLVFNYLGVVCDPNKKALLGYIAGVVQSSSTLGQMCRLFPSPRVSTFVPFPSSNACIVSPEETKYSVAALFTHSRTWFQPDNMLSTT